MAISAKMVQELRERTGAPLMECKRALEHSAGDLEAAVDQLRKSGLKSADKLAGRSTSEGRVRARIQPDGRAGSILALTCQTDFVATPPEFVALAEALAAHALERAPASVDELLAQELGSGGAIGETIRALSGKMGENMRVTGLARLENPRGRVGAYVHHDQKQGALLSVSSSRPAGEIDAFLKQLAMHVVARKPVALSREEIPAEVVERERRVHQESEEVLSKPPEKRAKIAEGKLEKFFATAALLEQPWVLDEKLAVRSALSAALGPEARIEAFALSLASA